MTTAAGSTLRKGGIVAALLCLGSLVAATLGDAAPRPRAAFQGGQDEQDARQRRTPPDEIKPGERCVECHQDLIAPSKVHAPVSEEKCELCHILAAPPRHIFVSPEEPTAPCLECHQLPERPVVHDPVAKKQCLHCHVPHHSPKRYLLRKESEKELCGECHQAQIGTDMQHVHGPVAFGSCTLCHSPHGTRDPKLLKNPGSEGCLECHVEMQEKLSTANTVHKPVAEDCALCHDPHASNNTFQLKRKADTICLECHKSMLDALQQQTVVHAALTAPGGCNNCHDVHASSLPKLLKRAVKDACMSCHDQPIPRKDGEEFPGMGDLLRNSKYLHGPIREGSCDACHNPHGSMTFSLLRDPYPKRFYSPFSLDLYTLCFRCHDADVFTTQETRKLTRFRNGATNLHFLHVNQEKGRTCRTCHETHASNLPNHISTSVPFGSWNVPIDFVKTETGGSCSPGCHETRSYDYRALTDK